ncbi:uncharacterized protein FTJAE_4133 [Fusarium tjaetaba]|uniref:Uncharacterized protein n=1 Tax=Fusarium tjaetaba TaxID=1567544 RepID=A0A8H5S0A7_9HYPO|nr:uncharacterized protein FTJAE_4133 [Fusarium tjaetaba]KAF5641481.1 hypothetical protein FTJAE_4133 [Fusarium tjaetaba]
MSTTTTSTIPTDIGQALINALNNPTGNLTKSLPLVEDDGSITGKKGHRFILQSYGYLGNLRISLVAGVSFPADTSSFETLYPKASLPSLNSFDPLLYQQTETAMLDFWNACYEFNQYAVSSFWTIFAETQMLCQSLIDQLTGPGEASLQSMISTLTSQTYSQPGSENDSQFKTGKRESLQHSGLGVPCRLDQEPYAMGMNKTDSIQQGSKIQATKQEIDAVVKKFGLYDGDHYISTLDETFSMIQTVLNDSVEAAQAAKDNWNRNMMEANTAVSYIWIPVAGWVSGSSAIIAKQNDVRLAWAEYEAHIAKKSTDANKTAYALVGAVNLLSMQNGVMCDRLQSVGVALQEIQSTFAAIGNNLGLAATLMEAADGSVRTSLIANQQAIQAGIIKAAKEIQDTLSAVKALVTIDSNIQTTGITADITAPSIFSENPY